MDKQLFIKIDTEGAEYQVLEGSLETMCRTKKPIWLLEVCLQEFHPQGENPDYKALFELFWENGYQAYTATDSPRLVERCDIDIWLEKKSSNYHTFNYIFISVEMESLICD